MWLDGMGNGIFLVYMEIAKKKTKQKMYFLNLEVTPGGWFLKSINFCHIILFRAFHNWLEKIMLENFKEKMRKTQSRELE